MEKEKATQKKCKVNRELNLKNLPKRQSASKAKHRIGHFVKREGTIVKATHIELHQVLLENNQAMILRSLEPEETQFCSQSSTLVEMDVGKSQITELIENVKALRK